MSNVRCMVGMTKMTLSTGTHQHLLLLGLLEDTFQLTFTQLLRQIFLKLFFTEAIVALIVGYTSEYAWRRIINPYYAGHFRAWMETTAEEIYRLLAFIIYMRLVKMPDAYDYWKITPPFHGL